MRFCNGLFTLVMLFCITACSDPSEDTADWPTRKVNIIVFSSAGGATDLANRVMGDAMGDVLGVDVVISNMPGALGGTAVNYVWNQPRDGYNLIGLSEGALGHSVLGLHTSTAKDWEYFMVGGTPGIISVNANASYQTFGELHAAIKADPGQISIATSVPGCIWNIQWLLTKEHGGFDTRYIPYTGSFPSQTAALSGEVDIVWTGLGEQSEFLQGGRLRPLAVFDTTPLEFAGQTIPPITDYIPEMAAVMPIDQFVGLAVPSDTSEDIRAKIAKAFETAMKSAEVKQFADAKASTLYGWHGEEAKQVALDQEKTFAWTLWDAGIAKKSPEEFGISRP